jgi:EpsI family protein
LKSRYAIALTAALLLQAVVYYAVAYRSERIPAIAPLSTFPWNVPGWRTLRDVEIEPEIRDLLKADDILEREYVSASGNSLLSLFIAYFKTQRYGQNPHSPKNCLPGNGYEPLLDTKIVFNVPVWNRPIRTNQYVVRHGDQRSVVLYWYQSHNRVIASEYQARLWLVADAIRFHRSDTSIVRVVVPVLDNDVDAATNTGVEFIQTIFPDLLRQLPGIGPR